MPLSDILPIREMLRALDGVPGQGTYEAHLTIAPPGDGLPRFRALCERLGVKCVVIELPRGAVPSQPMTASYHRGTVQEAAREVARLAEALREAGFAIARAKLEAVVGNEGVPATDEEARALPAANYFEFHAKALLPLDADLDALRALCLAHDAHLSRNALKEEQGCSERFVTQRAYGVGRAVAEARFDALLEALAGVGYAIGSRLREYSLFDSDARIDAGWIDAP